MANTKPILLESEANITLSPAVPTLAVTARDKLAQQTQAMLEKQQPWLYEHHSQR